MLFFISTVTSEKDRHHLNLIVNIAIVFAYHARHETKIFAKAVCCIPLASLQLLLYGTIHIYQADLDLLILKDNRLHTMI